MHKKIQYILLLMLLFTSLIPATAKNKNRISLNDEWQFKQSISQVGSRHKCPELYIPI